MTRRELASLIAWALLPRPRLARAGDIAVTRERRYRADAQILVLSLPILRRSGVGGGSALWRDSRDASGPLRQLEFTGYSNPDRAAGLNRLGLIRETSHGSGDALTGSSYFGVMTSSPEESAEEARKALHSNATEANYTAIRGRTVGAQVETAKAVFRGPARLSPERWNDLVSRAEKALSTAPNNSPEFRAESPVPSPFLHALANVLRAPKAAQARYVYDGRLYRLWVRPSPDAHATDYFRGKRLIAPNAQISRVAGKLKREAGGKDIDFRVWIEQGAAQPVPLRIDFQPRGYLRVIFEAEA